jgi:drug/metabolite transporter (DMT)-like permease
VPPLSQTRAYAILLLIVALWGSYPATAKLALADLPPFILATLRCFLASGFLIAILARRGFEEARAFTPGDFKALGFLAFSGIFLATGFTYLAIYLTTASNAVILQAATPVMVAVGARLYLGERLSWLQWVGVVCSATGVLLVVTKGGWAALRPANLYAGDFLVLLAIAGWSAYTIYGKRVLAIHSPALATTAAYVLGSLMLLPLALATAWLFPAPRLASPIAWGVVLYQAILGALAHVWWYEGVKAVGPSRSAIFMNFQPVVGVLLAAALLGETITLAQVLGGLAVLVGVALTTRTRVPESRNIAS